MQQNLKCNARNKFCLMIYTTAEPDYYKNKIVFLTTIYQDYSKKTILINKYDRVYKNLLQTYVNCIKFPYLNCESFDVAKSQRIQQNYTFVY